MQLVAWFACRRAWLVLGLQLIRVRISSRCIEINHPVEQAGGANETIIGLLLPGYLWGSKVTECAVLRTRHGSHNHTDAWQPLAETGYHIAHTGLHSCEIALSVAEIVRSLEPDDSRDIRQAE